MTTTTSLPTGELTADILDGVPPDVYRRRWAILAVLCTSLMIVAIANTSLNVALPRMSEDLGLSSSSQQWVVDAYSLVFAGLLFTAGSLGDRWGRKRFAYELARQTEGYYVVVRFRAEPETQQELDRTLKIADEVIRHKVLLLPEKAKATASPASVEA